MTRQELFDWCRQQYGTEPDYPWNDWNALFANLDFLDEPHQRRPVKLFQIVIILHHIQPCVHRLLILPAGGKLLRQFPSALLLGLALGLVTIQKLDTKVFWYFPSTLSS